MHLHTESGKIRVSVIRETRNDDDDEEDLCFEAKVKRGLVK